MAYSTMSHQSAGYVVTASNYNQLTDNDEYLYANLGIPTSGWIADSDTWVYVSATSFKVTGKDVTAKFRKGTKVKLTQTSAKYFVVTASAYSTDTTITVTAGSDYSIANATITSPYYSYIPHPEGFPAYFNWTPTFAGFSANPTVAGKFRIDGLLCYAAILTSSPGTSNSATFTLTLPIAPAFTVYQAVAEAVNSGAYVSTAQIQLVAASTTANIYKDAGATGWATSGDKYAEIAVTYSI